MLTPACRGSGSPEKAKLLCWSCELLFAVFECSGGCKDAWADAGMPEGTPERMQEGSPIPWADAGMPERMQEGSPVPWADAGMPERMQEGSPMCGWMQGCPGGCGDAQESLSLLRN